MLFYFLIRVRIFTGDPVIYKAPTMITSVTIRAERLCVHTRAAAVGVILSTTVCTVCLWLSDLIDEDGLFSLFWLDGGRAQRLSLCRNLRDYWSVVGKWSRLVWKHGRAFANVILLLSALHHCFSAASQPHGPLLPPPLSYTALNWHLNKEEGC